jgi:hypothetical protein
LRLWEPFENHFDGLITSTDRLTPSLIPIQILCTVVKIEDIDALYQLIESPANLPARESACEPKPDSGLNCREFTDYNADFLSCFLTAEDDEEEIGS